MAAKMDDKDSLEHNDEVHDVENENIVYKKEKPFLKIGLWMLGSFVAYCVIVFSIGFIIGLSGSRPPTVDSNAIQNQWYKITGETPPPDSTTELDKVQEEN